ncbi:MAG: hypothetical protein GY757_54095 [bacterium]|nr:hypothetical protein [bacterium]
MIKTVGSRQRKKENKKNKEEIKKNARQIVSYCSTSQSREIKNEKVKKAA